MEKGTRCMPDSTRKSEDPGVLPWEAKVGAPGRMRKGLCLVSGPHLCLVFFAG